MAKMTKAQAKRMLLAIRSKSQKLCFASIGQSGYAGGMSFNDMAAIEKIIKKNLQKLG